MLAAPAFEFVVQAGLLVLQYRQGLALVLDPLGQAQHLTLGLVMGLAGLLVGLAGLADLGFESLEPGIRRAVIAERLGQASPVLVDAVGQLGTLIVEPFEFLVEGGSAQGERLTFSLVFLDRFSQRCQLALGLIQRPETLAGLLLALAGLVAVLGEPGLPGVCVEGAPLLGERRIIEPGLGLVETGAGLVPSRFQREEAGLGLFDTGLQRLKAPEQGVSLFAQLTESAF